MEKVKFLVEYLGVVNYRNGDKLIGEWKDGKIVGKGNSLSKY